MSPCWRITHMAPPPVSIGRGELGLQYHSGLDMVTALLCLDVGSKKYCV